MAEAVRESHESPEVNAKRILLFVLAFVAFAMLLFAGLAFYFRLITRGEPLTAGLQHFPAPELQPNPTQDYRTFESQRRGLDGYHWADAGKTLVHIPIERAMTLVAGRGAAAYDPAPDTPAFPVAGLPPLDGAPRAEPRPMAAPYGYAR